MLKRKALWLLAALPLVVGCQTTPAQDGAILGTALGAGLGAIIGHQSGHQGEGALIGAGAGALTGALLGDAVGQPVRRRERHRYQQPTSTNRTYQPTRVETGHYETRVVRSATGETYEERVWIPHH